MILLLQFMHDLVWRHNRLFSYLPIFRTSILLSITAGILLACPLITVSLTTISFNTANWIQPD